MRKIITSIALLCFFTILSMSASASSEEILNWQDSGIPQEPVFNNTTGEYEIYTPNHLAWIALKTNDSSNPNTFEGWTFRLMCDINLSGREWTPIGGWNGTDSDLYKIFRGTFEGNNHIIHNMKITTTGIAEKYYTFSGLFGQISDANIKNIYLKSVCIDMKNNCGGLIGSITDTNGTSSKVSNCRVTGTFKGEDNTGGVIGSANGEYDNFTIDLVSFEGNVEGINKVGGIIGIQDWEVYVKNSFSSGSVLGNTYVGGLIGAQFASSIEDCYSLTNVQGEKAVGGLIGVIVGSNHDYSLDATRYHSNKTSYSFGDITGNSYVGGLFGGGTSYAFTNYWNISATHILNGNKLDMLSKSAMGSSYVSNMKLTTEQMKTKDSFGGFNFNTNWEIETEKNNGLPYLKKYDYDVIQQRAYTSTNILDYGSYGIGTIELFNMTSPCYIVIAKYKFNKFVNVEFREYKKSSETFAITEDIDTVKIMVWESIGNLKPISNVEVKKI